MKSDAKSLDGIGEIMVSPFRTNEIDEIRIEPNSMLSKDTPSDVAEKSLKGKALSHGVEFGQQQIFTQPLLKVLINVDGADYPIAVFLFKYRSREALQSELIIPRSPSPEAAPPSPLRSRSGTSGESDEARLARLRVCLCLAKSMCGGPLIFF